MTNSAPLPPHDLTQAALAELARRELAKRHLLDFTTYTWPKFRVGRHYVWLCQRFDEYRQRVEAGEIVRVMLSMPPRYLKSELTKRLCAQLIGLHPDWPMIYTSYAASLAQKQSRDIRDIVRGEAFSALFGRLSCSEPEEVVELSKDSSSVQRWGIQGHRGGMLAAGAGGGITGFGFKVGVLDDLFKDRKEANSETIRADRWDWLVSTFLTRLEEWNAEALAEQDLDAGALILFPMTRWHEDDVAGRLQAKMEADAEAEQWEVIKLPALAEADDPLGRQLCEPLWPEKHSQRRLYQIRLNNPFEFDALYQQNPQPGDGAEFLAEWFDRTWTTLPKLQGAVQCWDTAFKDNPKNDSSVGVIVALGVDWNFYVIDARYGQLRFEALLPAIEGFYRDYGKAVFVVGIEDKGSGTSAIQVLESNGLIPVEAIPAAANKQMRAAPTTPYYKAGRVFFPAGAEWLAECKRQHTKFPNGAHDDWVDAICMAIMKLVELFGLTASGDTQGDGEATQAKS